ncbi:MAG: hypothetical protein J0H55_00805 [Chitinophagaceae bacterium]|nr:hypothetical protein [Chitinophagaceae bacterium]
MSTTRSITSRKFYASLAILFFLIPLLLFFVWTSISIKDDAMSDNDKIQAFLNYFPSWMQSFKAIHIFSILCCFVAIIFSRMGFKRKLLSQRLTLLFVMFGSILLIFFSIAKLVL